MAVFHQLKEQCTANGPLYASSAAKQYMLACADAPPGAANAGAIDKFALYQDAVQAPHGDISWILRFYRQYVGLQVCTGSWGASSPAAYAPCDHCAACMACDLVICV